MNGRALFAGLLIVSVSVSSCAAAPTASVIALPNGYYLQPASSGALSIERGRGSTVVPGPIAAYAVIRQVVTGALGDPPPLHRHYTNDLPYHGSAATRYFVLDTTTGKLDSGLDEAAWKMRMTSLDLAASIELHTPIFPE